MSSSIALTYRTEAGVTNHPATNQTVITDCNDGTEIVKKKFREVYIHWGGAAWVEDAVYNPLATEPHVVLRVDNQCNGQFSYIGMAYNDFRLLGICCQDCPVPAVQSAFGLDDAQVGVLYNATFQIAGAGPFSLTVNNKPAWMTITVGLDGLITFTGTPVTGDIENDVEIDILINNCGKPNDEGVTLTDTIDVFQTITFTNRTTPANFPINKLRYNGSNMFMAGSSAVITNPIITSPDAITAWTQRSIGTAGSVADVAYGNSVWVSVGIVSGAGRTFRSTDNGVTWGGGANIGASQATPRGIIYTTGASFIICGSTGSGNQRISKSTDDGVSWTAKGTIAGTWNDLIQAEGQIVCVGDGGAIMTSADDGETWISRTSNTTINLGRICYDGTQFLAIGRDSSDKFVTSPDGLTWTQQTLPFSYSVGVIAAGTPTATLLYVISDFIGQTYVSEDLTHWRLVNTPPDSATHIIFGAGLFVAGGIGNATNRIWTSPGY